MKKVVNSEALTRIFGEWPSFHDAEVTAIRLDRGIASGPDGEPIKPTLEADVHVFEMTDQLTVAGFYELHKHKLVTLAFRGIDELELNSFNHQNVLFGLALRDITDRQLEVLKWAVSFDSSFGLDGSFLCKEIEVLRAVPFDPPERFDGARQLPPSRAPEDGLPD